MMAATWFWKRSAKDAPQAAPALPSAPIPPPAERRCHTDMREFWRWCRTAGTVNPDRMTRAELERAYRLYCTRRNLEPLPSWHFSRSLKAAGFERYRHGGSGPRPWLYRAAPVRPDAVAPASTENATIKARAAA